MASPARGGLGVEQRRLVLPFCAFNLGVRVPVNETAGRDTQLVMYLLWDWFDGGFFDGW